jgi:hypothetical protein
MSIYRQQSGDAQPSRLRIEIDDDTDIAARLRALYDAQQSVARAYRTQYDALPEDKRKDIPLPLEESIEQMFERALHMGAASMLYGARPPNSVLCIGPRLNRDAMNGRLTPLEYKKGDVVTMSGNLPVGAEVIALETSRADGPNWLVRNLCFGAMPLAGQYGECVPLSTLRYITRNDLLSVFDHRRTKVDVLVSATIICKKDGATFDGFRLHLFQEEMCCAIHARLEPSPCEHPIDAVIPIVYSDVEQFTWHPQYGAVPQVGPRHMRYRCTKCSREVVRNEVPKS